MDPVFDKYANNYDEGHTKAVEGSGFEPSYFHEYKLKEVKLQLDQKGLSDKPLKILNFGCGTGNSDPFIRKYLPNARIFSTDISEESVRVAAENNKQYNVTYAPFDGVKIPFEKDFDIIFIANVFHHIPRHLQTQAMESIYSHLKKDGLVFIFELNPYNPATRWVFKKNDEAFDQNANMISPPYAEKLLSDAGFNHLEKFYTIFFPKPLSALIPLEQLMKWLPLGAHFYFMGKK